MRKKKNVSDELWKQHHVDEIVNLVESMKNYIANDYTGDDSATPESSTFSDNAHDLMDAVTFMMFQGGFRGPKIKEIAGEKVDKTTKQNWEISAERVQRYTADIGKN